MEHIVQFAIGIDDDAIVAQVSAHAEKEIIKNLQQQVANKIFQPHYYRGNADPVRDNLSCFTEKLVKDFFEENKDNILDKAAAMLADRLFRSKKGKELLDNLNISSQA